MTNPDVIDMDTAEEIATFPSGNFGCIYERETLLTLFRTKAGKWFTREKTEAGSIYSMERDRQGFGIGTTSRTPEQAKKMLQGAGEVDKVKRCFG